MPTTPDTGIMNPASFQIVMLLFGAVCVVLWAMVQFNVSRFVNRQDGFSKVKDDHEKRLTHIETMLQNSITQDARRDMETNKTFDRVEKNMDEVRQDLKQLTTLIYKYLLSDKQKSDE